MGKTWPNREGVLVFFLLKIRSRFSHWSRLLLLVFGTIVTWQFRYIESGPVYWRNADLHDLTNWKHRGGTTPPKIISNDSGKVILEFAPQRNRPSQIQSSWLATGTEQIKVRIRHRSVGEIKAYPGQKRSPVLIAVTGIDGNNHPILDHVGHIVVQSPTNSWRTSEAVMPLDPKSRKFSFSILASGEEGLLQISALDITGVQKAPWFTLTAIIICLLWTAWIFQTLKPHQARKWISLITTIWLLGWGAYLIFPRTIDIPRPFFPTFWITSSDEPLPEESAIIGPANKEKIRKKSGSAPAIKLPPTENVRKWFKSFGGGRFLMHLGVMGLFTGGLLLLLPLRNAWPFILSMIVGIELLPALLIKNSDSTDVIDLLAYLLAIALAIPIAARTRKLLPEKWRQLYKT